MIKRADELRPGDTIMMRVAGTTIAREPVVVIEIESNLSEGLFWLRYKRPNGEDYEYLAWPFEIFEVLT
jgi:hypothetical protein